MDIFSWAQQKIEEAAVFLGFLTVAAVSFLQPVITESRDQYSVAFEIEGAYTERIDELIENSVHLGIVYTGTVYRTDNTRRTFSITRSVVYQSLHDRYMLMTTVAGGGNQPFSDKSFTRSKDEVIRHLQHFSLTVDRVRAYSCVVTANIKVLGIDSESFEEKLWDRQEPGITFYFNRTDPGNGGK